MEGTHNMELSPTTAAPLNIKYGTRDLSIGNIYPAPVKTGNFVPLVFFYGEKGSNTKMSLPPEQLRVYYGANTFDRKKPWYKNSDNQTLFLQEAYAATGTTSVTKRIKPVDAGDPANVVVWMDVISTPVPNYVRNSQGGLIKEGLGYKVDDTMPTIPGHKIKYIAEYVDDTSTLDTLLPKTGTMTIGPTTSQMYPLYAMQANSFGSWYNNLGHAITINRDADTRIATQLKSLPYKLTLFQRSDEYTSPSITLTLDNEPYGQFVVQKDAINPLTNAVIDFNTVFDTKWYNEQDPAIPLKFFEYATPILYRKNIEILQKKFLEIEEPYITNEIKVWDDGNTSATAEWFDYTVTGENITTNEFGLFNIFGITSLKGVRPFTVVHDVDTMPALTGTQMQVQLSETTPVWLRGGKDGTMSVDALRAAIKVELADYADINNIACDIIASPETVYIDTGSGLDTNENIGNFISGRKDTVVIGSTHDNKMERKFLSPSDERAVGVSIATALSMFPDSSHYGTPTIRAAVVQGTGEHVDNRDSNRVALTLELAKKLAAMMGGDTGVWDESLMFDIGENATFTSLKAIEPSFVPPTGKISNWRAQLITPVATTDRRNYRLEALQTIYPYDTSIANNLFVAFAIGVCTRIGERTHRQFTGASRYKTSALFKDAVFRWIRETELSKNYIGKMCDIEAVVSVSDAEEAAGYIWSLTFKISGGVMKTVQLYTTELYRADKSE